MNKDAVKNFADEWYERGDEKSDTQKFWLTLLRDVFDVDRPEKFIDFEQPVPNGFIDGFIAKTKVLIEQKSFDVDLSKEIVQSDGTKLTPYEQALRYAQALDEPPRWIITCNFSEFRIYKAGREDPTVIKLRDLRYQFPRLKFLIDPNADDTPPEEKISDEAAKIIEAICKAFDKNYYKREPAFRDSLSKLCTRLVFCFYADDAKIFTEEKFGDYLNKFPPEKIRDALQKFFDALNTPYDQRDGLDDDLKKFPYVNGGLLEEQIPILPIDENLKLTITRAHILKVGFVESIKFSWHEISPPIFGAMFESVVSRRRESGMFYTSVENIHKVIDPLFLDDLRDEFEIAKRKQIKNRAEALLELQEKISTLTFLDPACGSGNFLTETYLSLRRLENEILEALHSLTTLPENPVKVSINQFFGIEINSFAAAVAQTALWIAENQMLQETEGALGIDLDALPLKNHGRIVCANALRVDWKKVFEKDEPNHFDFIIGNPPFVGGMMTDVEQRKDLLRVWGNTRGVGEMDYVSAWYRKASDFMSGTKTRTAFVSTNSINQGQQACTVWKNLFAEGIHIDFAHRTFKWSNDSDEKKSKRKNDNAAHVHCVVVGFSCAANDKPKKIFDGKKIYVAKNINAYLVDGEDIFVESRSTPIQESVPKMHFGSMPRDGGNLIVEADDLDYFLSREPAAEKFIRSYLGADEFIKGKKRYCLWLDGVSLDEIKKFPLIAERVEACKNFRLASKAAATRNFAETPHLFCQIAQPATNYVLVPRVSSERRRYVPMGFMSANIIASDATLMVPDAELYHFGILTSAIHMAWVRLTSGRLKSDYRHSKDVVYNNFPWPEVDGRRRRMIEHGAQEILNVRADFPSWTFAKLYSEETMPDELRLAHKSNDYAVAMAYGFENFWEDEARVTAELMKLYKSLTKA